MNLYLILYGLVALAVLVVGVTKLHGMGMMMGAALYGLLGGGILVIYGMRWFGSDKSILSNAPVPWPPVMNTCPDYLTYYKRTVGGVAEDTCIDTMGIARNSLMLKQAPSSGPPPNEDAYFFSLKTTKADAAGRKQELCQRAISCGLTWEGITNGESCINPDGSKGSPPPAAGSGGSACPSR